MRECRRCLLAALSALAALLVMTVAAKAMALMKIKLAATVLCAAAVVSGGGVAAVRGLWPGKPAGVTPAGEVMRQEVRDVQDADRNLSRADGDGPRRREARGQARPAA